MRRALFILLVALGGFLTAFIGGSAVAGALELPGTGHLDGLTSSVDQSQTGTVDNSTDQSSKAKVDNQQSNVYVPISILSPSSGDNRVEQGNQASNQAGSATVNGTDQEAHQGQNGTVTTTDDSHESGWNGGGWMGGGQIPLLTGTDSGSGNQAGVDQSQTGTVGNETTQSSKAKVANDQSNVYVPISILSPSSGDNEVRQGNQASNRADSVVVNGTDQGLDQSQTGTATTTDDSHESGWNGGGWMGGGIALLTGTDSGSGNQAGVDQSQTGTVDSHTSQDSKAKVDDEQHNTAIPVSLLSPTAGDSHVVQSNQASNQAGSLVANGTWQDLGQSQTGTATTTDSRTSGWPTWDHHEDGSWDHDWNMWHHDWDQWGCSNPC